MTLQKKDFIEIEFTGRVRGGEVFDSNIKSEVEKINPRVNAKPFVFCLGEGMFLKGVDDFLINKEKGEYEIELKPDDAFGKRDPKLVQTIPMKIFIQHKINPYPGAVFNFDGRIAKVLTVSGGRVTVDFNNPLAGKDIVYKVNVLRKIEDINEKIKSLNEFFFRKDFEFEINEKKLILNVDKGYRQFAEMFRDKYKEILDLDLGTKEIENKKDMGGETNKLSQQSL